MKRDNIIQHYWDFGSKLMSGINQIAFDLGIEKFFFVEGHSCSPNYVTKDKEGLVSLAFRTLFAQSMLDKKILMPYKPENYILLKSNSFPIGPGVDSPYWPTQA